MNSDSPLLVEVTRGERVESLHAVDAIAVDADGSVVLDIGNSDIEIFPRSSVKALQAVLLVESGAADTFQLQDHHLALACSSHNAETFQIEGVREMFSQSGLAENCLECGPEMPRLQADQISLGERKELPQRIHNNCSGKHAGFLAVCACQGLPTGGYTGLTHPFQKALAGTMEEILGFPHNEDNHGIDGCSIPTYSVPMHNLAVAFARFGTGKGTGAERQKAFTRLREACLNHPEMVAGTNRACTLIMKALGNRAFVKVGAEGVYTASLPEAGIGIAMKARDGAFRAVEVALAHLISNFLTLSDKEKLAIKPLSAPQILDRNGNAVGKMGVKGN